MRSEEKPPFSCIIVIIAVPFDVISASSLLFQRGENTATMTIELAQFRLWKVPILKAFLRARGVKTSTNKEELVALVFACHVMDVSPVPSNEEYRKDISKEFANLLVVDGKRMPDPCELKAGWENEQSARTRWPPTMYGDIVEFMHECNVPGDCRRHLLSEYKLHKGYSYFNSSFLQGVFYHSITEDNEFCYLRAKVTPSQNIRNEPHCAWVLIHKASGRIQSAYCTCMAGMFSQCNHVAAILFKVDWVWTSTDRSVTSVTCQWNAPGPKAMNPSRIKDMAISKPRKKSGNSRKTKKEGHNINSSARRLFSTVRSTQDQPLTLDQWAGIAYDNKEQSVAFNYAAAHAVPRYQPDADINVEVEVEVETSGHVPDPLPDVAKKFDSVDNFMEHLHTVPCDAHALAEATQNQNSAVWSQQRRGRIGASNAHACKTMMKSILDGKPRNPNRLVQMVLGEGPDLGNIKAVKYGREKEAEAREAYRVHHTEVHNHPVTVSNSGLFVHSVYQYISASPDGLVSCDCGFGLVEIKCPFKDRGQHPGRHIVYLEENDGRLQLKRSHSYYTQCQQQLGVTGRAFCDFFVYCGNGKILLERIFPDDQFMGDSLCFVKDFFAQFVAPALISSGGAVSSNGGEMGSSHSPAPEKEIGFCKRNAVVISDDEFDQKAAVRTHTCLPVEVTELTDQHPQFTITVAAPQTRRVRGSVLLKVSMNVDQPTESSKTKPGGRGTKPRVGKKSKCSSSGRPHYSCGSCANLCVEPDEITNEEENSVGCDKCGLWFHYACVNFKADNEVDEWFCPACSRF